MIFGGLPYFLSMLNSNDSFRQNADRLLFSERAILRDETSKLLESTLKNNPVYGSILKELSRHIYGMKRIDCIEKDRSGNSCTFH
jgi:hypothetical protein